MLTRHVLRESKLTHILILQLCHTTRDLMSALLGCLSESSTTKRTDMNGKHRGALLTLEFLESHLGLSNPGDLNYL